MNKPITDTSNYVKLMFPNDTFVTIEGDVEVIKQLVNRLDGVVINFTPNRGGQLI